MCAGVHAQERESEHLRSRNKCSMVLRILLERYDAENRVNILFFFFDQVGLMSVGRVRVIFF